MAGMAGDFPFDTERPFADIVKISIRKFIQGTPHESAEQV